MRHNIPLAVAQRVVAHRSCSSEELQLREAAAQGIWGSGGLRLRGVAAQGAEAHRGGKWWRGALTGAPWEGRVAAPANLFCYLSISVLFLSLLPHFLF